MPVRSSRTPDKVKPVRKCGGSKCSVRLSTPAVSTYRRSSFSRPWPSPRSTGIGDRGEPSATGLGLAVRAAGRSTRRGPPGRPGGGPSPRSPSRRPRRLDLIGQGSWRLGAGPLPASGACVACSSASSRSQRLLEELHQALEDRPQQPAEEATGAGRPPGGPPSGRGSRRCRRRGRARRDSSLSGSGRGTRRGRSLQVTVGDREGIFSLAISRGLQRRHFLDEDLGQLLGQHGQAIAPRPPSRAGPVVARRGPGPARSGAGSRRCGSRARRPPRPAGAIGSQVDPAVEDRAEGAGERLGGALGLEAVDAVDQPLGDPADRATSPGRSRAAPPPAARARTARARGSGRRTRRTRRRGRAARGCGRTPFSRTWSAEVELADQVGEVRRRRPGRRCRA